MRWQHPDAMRPVDFPAADRPIIDALRLPDRMLITGMDPARIEVFLLRLERAFKDGIRLVQLRAHGLSSDRYLTLSQAVLELCRVHGARLVLNPPSLVSQTLSGQGLHLGSRRLMSLDRRPSGYDLVGASCHNAAELRKAEALGLNYALLSPVMPTASHPHATPLGWDRFSQLAKPALLPVYALGGMSVGDIEIAKRCGGQGIAAISGLWPGSPMK
jgi:8-oxo-dGTP diphosphatase